MNEGISVVICCYNSARVIRQTLEGLCEQTFSPDWFELIIVDNNCTDDTVEIVNDTLHDAVFSHRIVKEDEPGLMNARIRGVDEVQKDITLFVDDDNILEADFLQKLYQLYEEKPDVGTIGVQVKPLVDEETPSWFYDYLGVYACGRQADASSDVTKTRMTLFGAGLSFRTPVIKKILVQRGHFFLMGRTGDILLRGDDSEMCMQCILEGWKVWYEDDLTLEHNILSERITPEYVKNARFGGGVASIVLDLYRERILGMPVQAGYISLLLKTAGLVVNHTIKGLITKNGSADISANFYMAYLKGRLYGLRHFGVRQLKEIQQKIVEMDNR